jgi:hypothetical protein
MPPVRFLVFKHLAHHSKLVAVILLLSKIIPAYSYYAEKGLVYIAIIALFSCYPSSCSKCTKLNIYSSCNIYSVFNAKYIYFTVHLYTL